MCLSVFRQGDVGTNWYAVLSGSLDMNVSETGDSKVSESTHCNPVFSVCNNCFTLLFQINVSYETLSTDFRGLNSALADDNQLVVPRSLACMFGPRPFSTSGPAAWNTVV